MATSSLSKEEYLKRYLSGGPSDDGKKKKKKKKQGAVKQSRNMIIHDDDIDASKLTPVDLKGDDIVDKLNADEAPLVADFVDERPKEDIQLEQFRKSSKWKLSMNKDHEEKQQNNKSDSDQSPPGRPKSVPPNRKKSHTKSSRHHSDSDDTSAAPHKRTRHDSSDSDMSPLRMHPDAAPSRRTRHDSDSDLSPPRKKTGSDADISPPRRGTEGRREEHRSRKDHKHSGEDRRRRGGKHSDSKSSSSKRKVQNSDSDMSPPRRKRKDSDSDLSPPRRKRQDSDSDLSPPRRKRQDSDSDLSPPRRKRQDSDSDLSPPRRSQDKAGKSRLDKMSSGAKAGLQNARTMRKENDATKRRNAEMFAHMTDEMSGRKAETVFRDKDSGRTRNLKMERLKQREEEQKKAEEDEKFMQWGKGMAQTKEKQSNLQDHLHEMDKPMARYRDDKDLDDMLKDKDREGDPMLAFMKKKQAQNNAKLGIKEKPKYKGAPPPPTRFNIWPGYRWDGVDRSNGFEKKFFLRNADKKAMSEVAYKWSVEDM